MRKTSPLLIALAWLIVGIPFLWGFSQTVQKAIALFQ
ncbi:MAG TPA: oxalate:formate antiporter [Alphaproteobacteria bacterium]|jgi:hypothetical protein|nr:oxalate:formate antiporter [Alphaproteobacteria bacterium]